VNINKYPKDYFDYHMYSPYNLRLKASKTGYSLARNFLSEINKYSRKIVFQTEDYETVVRLGETLIRYTPDPFLNYDIPEGLETEFLGMKFRSPLVLAAFKGDYRVMNQWVKLGLGGAITKTIMPNKQWGNKRPRHIIFKDKDGREHHINSYGLPSKGVYKEIMLLEDSGLLESGIPLGLSIGGQNVEEYLFVFQKLLDSTKIKLAKEEKEIFIQLNIGCPNVETGQKNICKFPTEFIKLMNGVREIDSEIPLLIKTPPYLFGIGNDESNKKIFEVAEICTSHKNVGMTLANTIPVDASNPDYYIAKACSKLSTKQGGLSGKKCTPRALELIRKIRDKYDYLPISMCGGVETVEDVLSGLAAGAKLFEMATAVGQNMYVIPEINIKLIGRTL
jgi:dihydroorotate dehydrogenase